MTEHEAEEREGKEKGRKRREGEDREKGGKERLMLPRASHKDRRK